MLVAAGVVVGLAGAAASSRVLESFLCIAADDRLTFVAVPLVLAAVALVACWLPARRATRVDPIKHYESSDGKGGAAQTITIRFPSIPPERAPEQADRSPSG